MKILLAPVGTLGDVHPFVRLALELRSRGHEVTMVANDNFSDFARRHRIEFVPVGTKEESTAFIEEPDLWHPVRNLRVLAERCLNNPAALFEVVRDLYFPGRTVVAASGLAFGARLAQEKLGVPRWDDPCRHDSPGIPATLGGSDPTAPASRQVRLSSPETPFP